TEANPRRCSTLDAPHAARRGTARRASERASGGRLRGLRPRRATTPADASGAHTHPTRAGDLATHTFDPRETTRVRSNARKSERIWPPRPATVGRARHAEVDGWRKQTSFAEVDDSLATWRWF